MAIGPLPNTYYECHFKVGGQLTYPAVAWEIQRNGNYMYGDGTKGKFVFKNGKFKARTGPLSTVPTLKWFPAKGKRTGYFTFVVKDPNVSKKPFLVTCDKTSAQISITDDKSSTTKKTTTTKKSSKKSD